MTTPRNPDWVRLIPNDTDCIYFGSFAELDFFWLRDKQELIILSDTSQNLAFFSSSDEDYIKNRIEYEFGHFLNIDVNKRPDLSVELIKIMYNYAKKNIEPL